MNLEEVFGKDNVHYLGDGVYVATTNIDELHLFLYDGIRRSGDLFLGKDELKKLVELGKKRGML